MIVPESYRDSTAALKDLKPETPINLVLSGGGEKGVAHIALLEKIEQLGLKIKTISCCSAGSLVGTLYASGLNPKEILSFFQETPLFKYTWFSTKGTGIFNSIKYKDYLDGLIKENFEELDIPIFIAATNLNKGEIHYFNRGKIMFPLMASCAVPAIFRPIEIGNELYVDGGVMDNYPIYPILNKEGPIVGSHLGIPIPEIDKNLNTIPKVLQRSNDLMSFSVDYPKFFRTDVLIRFPLNDLSSFDSKLVNTIYERAHKYLSENGL